MSDIFEEVLNETLGLSMRPFYFHYSTPETRDVNPMSGWVKEGKDYVTTVRMLGVAESDVKVEAESYGLHVHGESETFGKKYSQDLKLGISKDTMANIYGIKYKVQNGMCQITLNMREPAEKKIKITRE